MQLPPRRAAGPVATTTPARLLAGLATDPSPRLTWYGPAGARVELSGRVLTTWVAKTAHLLLEEADVGPGSVVALHLGPDWRAPVFWLAARYLGAVVVAPTAPDADVRVVPEAAVAPGAPAATSTGGLLVVVAEPAVAAPARTPLPRGALDYGGEVGGQPDALPAPGPQEPLGDGPGEPRTAAGRVLLGPGTDLADLARLWAGGGSAVWHTGLDGAALARVAAQENVRG